MLKSLLVSLGEVSCLFGTRGCFNTSHALSDSIVNKWNVKTCPTKYFTSQEVVRIKYKSSISWNRQFLYNIFYLYINNMLAAINLQNLFMFMLLIK